MTSRIFRSTLFVAVIVLVCSLAVAMGVLYSHFSGVQVQQLKDKLSLAVTGTEQYGNAFLENVESEHFRITWIAADGCVLYDTMVDQTAMENHINREEFQQALQTGTGSSIRASTTLTERTLYEARRLQDGTVLRISTSQKSGWYFIFGMTESFFLIVIVAFALSALLSQRMAKKIVEPLNTLDLEQPLKNSVYDEITPLLRRINQQHIQIAEQLDTLRRKTDEFEQITGNMKDGLVLLDSTAAILTINPTAMHLFETDESCVGKNFLTIERSSEMRRAVNDALDKGQGSAVAQYHGRDYQLDLSRIESNGECVGAVVLAFDITERLNAERLRREFSANVSHELKSPLQGIIGSAELFENGLVKPEDASRFIGHIRTEATRLMSLVEDIIRLSQLDEGAVMPLENVSMLELAQSVVSTLSPAAQTKNVTLTLSGSGFTVNGVRRLLDEIITNLCENAVKYNVPGGRVDICVENNVLSVRDTGIGIPPEHQHHVFERFYRVDKSHSRQSGGTGLGLSIVKHAAAYHNAALTLESKPGEGTTVTVIFP
ncbi:MAG: two-component sensor histidine kinase [Ruminococcaceae bacterium]|nr:two-component sensor histidine kinase [Oscillospiraceae bacterium]